MAQRPHYLLFAGVNGAGKSTLFHSGMWKHGSVDATIPRVNPDDILKSHGWDWRDENAQLRAGREALQCIRAHFANGESFNQETTLAGRMALKNIRQAHELGFRIIMFYVSVQDPEIANARIAHRTAIGGHSIDPEVVRRRYEASHANVLKAIELCDEAYLYDNTVALTLMARFERQELAYVNVRNPGITWHKGIIEQFGYEEIPFP